jgi:hypothetical protein
MLSALPRSNSRPDTLPLNDSRYTCPHGEEKIENQKREKREKREKRGALEDFFDHCWQRICLV